MMKTIIIPADLTDNYTNSLKTALLFEKKRPLSLVFSFSDEIEEEQVKSKFNEIKATYSSLLQHSETNFRLTRDKSETEPECADISPTNNDSAILLSYDDSSAEKTQSTESVVKYIRGCRQNYITIPESRPPEKIEKIIFPIHTLTKVRHKVTFTSVIAKLFNAEIHVVTLQSTNQKDIVKRLNLYTLQVINHLRSYGVNAQFETLEGKKIPEMILEYSNSVGADLISIIPEDVKGPRFFSKGYLYDMIETSTLPMMVVAPRKAKITGSFSASG